MSAYDIDVRQPQPNDIVGLTIPIALLGTAFEASYAWKLTNDGTTLAEGYFQAGSTGTMQALVQEVSVDGVTSTTKAQFEINGDTGGDEPPPTVKVSVFVVPGAVGYIPYDVRPGDSLSAFAQNFGGVATVENIALVNEIADPDYIEAGQSLRIPA